MIAARTNIAAVRGASRVAPRCPAQCFTSNKRAVVVRFRDDEKAEVKTNKLSEEQLREIESAPEGKFSPRTAEMRANMGTAAKDLHMMQTFDGPGPETINGRLAMLGVLTGLLGEFATGKGLLEQTAHHPVTVFLSFVLISIATYVPISRGYTRKEPFENGIWTPKAENWNGRLAMIGFAGMVITEFVAGYNTLQAWGIQPHS